MLSQNTRKINLPNSVKNEINIRKNSSQNNNEINFNKNNFCNLKTPYFLKLSDFDSTEKIDNSKENVKSYNSTLFNDTIIV